VDVATPMPIRRDPFASAAIVEDNVAVPFGVANIPDVEDSQTGYCTIDQWRARKCSSRPMVVDIPFS